MEKLIYALWRDEAEARADFNGRLLGPIADTIAPHVRGLRINLQDDSVAEGTNPRFVVTQPQMEAAVQLWVDSAYGRAPIEAALATSASRIEGWLVAESVPLPNRAHPPTGPGPTEGFAQVVFFERPDTLDFETWRRNWQDDHTIVATETQSNFEYIQNLVVRPLTERAAPYAAIVEECFPLAAIMDEDLYFDAPGNPAKRAANHQRMMESCARFMGPAGGDCIPMRQYDLKCAFPASA